MDLIKLLEKEEIERLGKNIPEFGPGDTVVVNVNVVEGDGDWRAEDNGEERKKWRSEHGACRDQRERCAAAHPAHSGRDSRSLRSGRGVR